MKLTFAELAVIRDSLKDHKRTLEYYVFDKDEEGKKVLNKEASEYPEYEQLLSVMKKVESAEF